MVNRNVLVQVGREVGAEGSGRVHVIVSHWAWSVTERSQENIRDRSVRS